MDNIPNGQIADTSIRLCFSYGTEKSRQCRRGKLSVNNIVSATPFNPVIWAVSPIISVDFLEKMEGTRSDSVLQMPVSIFPIYFPLSHAALQNQDVSNKVYVVLWSLVSSLDDCRYRISMCPSYLAIIARIGGSMKLKRSDIARLYLKCTAKIL